MVALRKFSSAPHSMMARTFCAPSWPIFRRTSRLRCGILIGCSLKICPVFKFCPSDKELVRYLARIELTRAWKHRRRDVPAHLGRTVLENRACLGLLSYYTLLRFDSLVFH